MRVITLGSLLLALVLVVCLVGCTDESTQTMAEPGLGGQIQRAQPASNPNDALGTLRDACIARDLDAYRELFTPDFIFVFDPVDVEEGPDVPVSWGWAEEMEATGNLFQSPLVDLIELEFEQSPPVDSSDEYPGTWRVDVSRIELCVSMHNEQGEPWFMLVEDGGGTFYLKPSPAIDLLESRPHWRVWRWEDERGRIVTGGRSEGMSWGRIKAFFR